MSEPRKAPPEIRLLILEALSDPYRRFLDQSTPSRSWLDHWDLTEEGFFRELCEDIRTYEIFLKPKKNPPIHRNTSPSSSTQPILLTTHRN